MRTIERDGRNSNGVSVFRMEYVGSVLHARISAPEMEVGDVFYYFGDMLTVKNIESERPHQTDTSVKVYDCILDGGNPVNLHIVKLPKPSDFLSKEEMAKWVASQPEKKAAKKSIKKSIPQTI